MRQYLNMLNLVLSNGVYKPNRTGVGTYTIFGHQEKFNLQEGFPLITTKKMFIKGIIHELLWFLSGDTNNKKLNDVGVHIWDEWSMENGDLGKIYSHQWRRWGAEKDEYGNWIFGEDQIANIIKSIKEDPWSRRHIVSAWHVGDVQNEFIALPPCHTLFQFNVVPDENGNPYGLNCHLYQRSCDLFLGVGFNIASYSLLTMMVAQVTNLKPLEFIHTYNDLHIYENHLEQVKEQLSREPRQLPRMIINPFVKNIDDFKYEDFKLEGYDSWPTIKAEIAI